jgi:hypothetical protein
MFECTLRIRTDDELDLWEDHSRVILRGMPNPGEILRLDDGREVEVISSGRVDFKAFTWAAPVAA